MSDLQALEQSAIEVLKRIESDFQPVGFANSFGAEDMVLTHLIANHAPGIEVFSLDTGRLPAETYSLMQIVKTKYTSINVKYYFPTSSDIESFEHENGPNAFYDSVELRKACCRIRKVVPLKRALEGKKAWITGLRREQSPTRKDLAVQEYDNDFSMEKFNPLLEWSEADVWAYIKENDIPYSELHDKGYPSIGCAPCTRAITVGEDVRAGRWWWENPETKECGLHTKKD